jgi:hemerythrin HHE cation binding domain-containing protein
MADVFEVLKQDHEAVKSKLAQLEQGPTANRGATPDQLTERKRLTQEVIIEESKHEIAEQQHFWPAVRELGPEGDRIADEAIGQEKDAERVLAELDRLDPDDERFETLLAGFTSDARAHIAFEEGHAWPMLRGAISMDRMNELGDKIVRAKQMAPTRPHPNVPAQPGVLKTAGPVAAAADKIRDSVTGRGRKS